MASSSESTFGQKLAKARQLLELVRSIKGFESLSPIVGVDEFGKLLDRIEFLNQRAIETKSKLEQSRKHRKEAYHAQDGLITLCKRIRDFVGCLQGGKNSLQYKKIAKDCLKMTSTRLTKRIINSEAEESTKKINTSEQSFSSRLHSAKNILVQIRLMKSFESAPIPISIPKLQSMIEEIEIKNNEVEQFLIAYKEAINNRQDAYIGEAGLQDSVKKIKLFISAAFGRKSNTYLEASKIKV